MTTSEIAKANRFIVLGINDDKDFCECCGKQNLKKVVWIEDTETGETKHFGTQCAMSPSKGFYLEKEIKTAVAAHKQLIESINCAAFRLYKKAGGTYTWVDMVGKANDMELLQQCIAEAKRDALAFDAEMKALAASPLSEFAK